MHDPPPDRPPAGLYFGVGIAANHRRNGDESCTATQLRNGDESCTATQLTPHRAFWVALPGLVRDGVRFTFRHGASKLGVQRFKAYDEL